LHFYIRIQRTVDQQPSLKHVEYSETLANLFFCSLNKVFIWSFRDYFVATKGLNFIYIKFQLILSTYLNHFKSAKTYANEISAHSKYFGSLRIAPPQWSRCRSFVLPLPCCFDFVGRFAPDAHRDIFSEYC